MSKTVRIVAAILAILMGLSAIGMVAMYISAAEAYDGTTVSASFADLETEDASTLVANATDLAFSIPCDRI